MKEEESVCDSISASLTGTGCWGGGVGGGQRRYYNAPQKVTLLRKLWGMCVGNLEIEGSFLYEGDLQKHVSRILSPTSAYIRNQSCTFLERGVGSQL